MPDYPYVGEVRMFLGGELPTDWYYLDGSERPRTDPLFSVPGAPVGPGDGTTTYTLPDWRGRGPLGRDDMGGTAAGRITVAGCGIDGTENGATGGSETHTLTTAEMPEHAHGASSDSAGAHAHTASGTATSAGAHTHTATTASAGAHTHTVSGTAASAGTHTHTITYAPGINVWWAVGPNNADSGNSFNMAQAAPGTFSAAFSNSSAGAHTHTVTGTAASAGTHTHTTTVASGGAHTHTLSVTVASAGAHTHTVTVSDTGGGGAHNNVQPSVITNFAVYVGVAE